MKKILIILVSLMTVSATWAQDEKVTLKLDQMFRVTADANAPYKLELQKIAGASFSSILFDYAGKIKAKGTYVKVGEKYLEDGHFTFYFQNGQIESEGEYDRGVKVGIWKRFDENGRRKGDKYYPAESADKIRESMLLEKSE